MKVVLFLVIAFCPFFSLAQTDPLLIADSLIQEGAKLETTGNFSGAIGKYKQAETQIKKNNLGKSYEALCSSLIGYAYYNNSKFSDALKHLKNSAYCFELDSNVLNPEYCMVLHDIAVVSYFNLHQSTDSLCLYSMKACNYAYEVYDEDNPGLARFFDLAGLCKLESHDFPAAKAILLFAYELLVNYRDSLPFDFIEVCGHLTKLYNLAEQQDSSKLFALEKLKQVKKISKPNDPKLSEAYYSYAFALNVGNNIDSSIIYLDSALLIYPDVCEPKEKAEFYYRGGQYYFDKKDLVLAKHYFIQSGTYLVNSNIANSLEGSCWLFVGTILLQELKITEAKPYLEKACELFKKYNGVKDSKTLQVCQMADALTKMSQTDDIRKIFPDISPNDLKEMFNQLADTSIQINIGNVYTTALLAEAKRNPNFKELPKAIEAMLSGRYEEVIEIIQLLFVKIIPGYQDSLNYFSDPDINSPTMETNTFLLALELKAIAYDQLGSKNRDFKKLQYAWEILEKCDTLMSNIRINAIQEDIGVWSGFMKGIYEQMITTSGKIFDITRHESDFNKTVFASERLKAYTLLESNDPKQLKSMVPGKLLDTEKKLVSKTLQLRRDLARTRQFKSFNPNTEKLLQDSLFLIEANLANLRSNLKVSYTKYWEANNEKNIASVSEVMKQLDAQTAIISYTCMVDESVSILVISSSQNSLLVGKPIANVKSMVATISDYVAGKSISKADYIKAANMLYNELIVNLPKTIKRLIIIPDGFLHYLPFEALLTEEIDASKSFITYPFLLKKYAISYGYSATITCHQLKNKNNITYPKFLLGYGIPEFDDFKSIRPICEANALKYDIRDNLNTSSKLDLLGQDLKSYQIVHITAHGRKTSQMDISGILLAKGEPVYYSDLYKLDITADLVLLLACLSGKGNVVTGEGVIGLNRALYAAGARNILLYRDDKLDNEANKFFCQKFYEQITSKVTQGYSTPLQQARIAMIDSDTYANPIYWAGYYLIGF